MAEILKTLRGTYRDTGKRIADGVDKEGNAILRGSPTYHEANELILADGPEARDLIARRAAMPAKLIGTFAALAEAVLPAESPKQAALLALPIRGVRVWCGQMVGGEMRPAAGSFGPTRTGISGSFGSAEEIEAHWTANPAAVPVFSYEQENVGRRAYRWKAGGLLEIST